MEYDRGDRVAGSIPEFGAIFMSNALTKKECLERKIFGLPSSQAEFVKQVKAGMMLFLFEFERRQLYGVYQASSDGAMDIVPRAFNYSGKRFPAQVCFTSIWYCNPLSESHFQDAIRENYFSARKFNFGLSKIQVHRLLTLFSSRKMKKEIIPQPMDRRSEGDLRFELSGRNQTEPTVIEEYVPTALSDYHASSLVKEDEAFKDDRVNNEGKAYPMVRGDFLAKRRRLGNVDMLYADNIAEASNRDDSRTNRIDSLRDSSDEVSNLAAVHQLLAVEVARKENEADKIRSAILSSEHVMDPSDVRATDEDISMQWKRFFDECNRSNCFSSECHQNPLDTSKRVVNEDKLLFDDCTHRNHNIVEHMAYSDGNLSLQRQATQVMEDHQCSMDVKVENKCHFEHNEAPLHVMKETNSVPRFPVNERINGEPIFGSCSVQNSSLTIFSWPLLHGDRISHDMQYPIVEGQATGNIVASSTRNAGYFESVGGQVAESGRFIKSEDVDNEKDFRTQIGPGSSLGAPSSFSQNKSSSSLSARLPEKGPMQKSRPPHATFNDATITISTPYIPEHPKVSHEFSGSMAANQNLALVHENPHRGPMENFYPYMNRPIPYIPESKKSSGSPSNTSELFCNKCLSTDVSRHQSSLRHEATSSFLKDDISMHVDRYTPVPVNDRGSLFSKSFLTQTSTNRENAGGEFVYHSKSSGNQFAFDGNFPAESQHRSKRVLQQMGVLAGTGSTCYEAKHLGFGAHCLEKDLAECGVDHEKTGALYSDSKKSVFSRLTYREEPQVGDERNTRDFGYMDATADEIMEMLQQNNNLSSRKLKTSIPARPKLKSIAVRQPDRKETTFDEKRVWSRFEIKTPTMEKKSLKDTHLAIEESNDELLNETRTVDFKRRSHRTSKNLVGASIDSSKCEKITAATAEVENPMKMKLKRKRLVRPVFGMTDSVAQGGEKSISISEASMPKDNTGLKEHLSPENQKKTKARVLPPSSNDLKEHTSIEGVHVDSSQALLEIHSPSMDSNIKEHSNPEEQKNIKEHSSPDNQKNIEAHVLPSSSNELDEHETSIVGNNTDSSQVLVEIHRPSMGSDIKEHSTPEEQKDIVVNAFPSLNNEDKENETSTVALHPDSSQALLSEDHKPFMDCNTKKHSGPEEQVDIKVPNEPIEQKTTILGLHTDNSQAPLAEITPQEGAGIQTFVEDISNKNVDVTAGSLNLEESSVGMGIGVGCLHDPTEMKGQE